MKIQYITTLLATGAAAFAIAAAPTATAADATVVQSPGNAQITATPGGDAAQQAADLQQPFGGDMGGLLFHHGGGGGHR